MNNWEYKFKKSIKTTYKFVKKLNLEYFYKKVRIY
jgi:hypothetical protein